MVRASIPAAAQPDLFADHVRPEAADGTPRQRPAASRGNPRAKDSRPTRTEDDMVRCLEETGRYRILRQLAPRTVRPHASPVAEGTGFGIVLDTETTGLDHATHEVIEIGMVAFTYDVSGIRDVVGAFSALREPSHPITPEITRITGITHDMVRGRVIDVDAVRRFVEPADIVIAHNARFDRPFCEKLAPGFDAKPWACSVSEIDWTALGFEGTKLGYLVGQAGYFHNGHRAVDDCNALLEVLAHPSRVADVDAPFAQLLASAARTKLRVHAIGSPFHTKDSLKGRGYRWSDGSDGRPKCWWRDVDEDAYADEEAFLREHVYGRDVEAYVQHLTACERYRA